MDFYYAEGSDQKGPVSEAELHRLQQEGTIADDTLIWREGLPSWSR